MELPDLGKHCSSTSCKRLDFLPMKCDACSSIFCNDHIHYATHNCSESYKKDKQVPVCPLCDKPIPLKNGELADVKVGAHIDSECQSDPAKERRKVYTNRCSKKGCKVKEMVSIKCNRCHQNYCLKHRHENDHGCAAGSQSNSPMTARSQAAKAAIARNQQNSKGGTIPQQSLLNSIGSSLARERQSRPAVPVGSFQSGLTEEQALQMALQLSSSDGSKGNSSQSQQEKDDLALAQAIAASERDQRRPPNNQSGSSGSNCVIN